MKYSNKNLAERRRAGLRRRLKQVRDAHGLPRLTNRQREHLLDWVMDIEGEALTDPVLRVIYGLAARKAGWK